MKEQIRIRGTAVALLRKKHSRFSRQKILAHEVAISERTLRKIEKGNNLWDKDLAIRIAITLGRTLDDIVFSAVGPKLIPTPPLIPLTAPTISRLCGKQLYPRFDKDSATLVGSADALFESARRAEVVKVEVHIELDAELTGHADELIALSREVSRETHPCFMEQEDPRTAEVRQRMRWLLVQLKGNDVLAYVCEHTKYLPESDEVAPRGKCRDFQSQVIIAFAPPQEWSETSVEVDVDHGQPYIIDWDTPIHLEQSNPAQPTG
ncbi:helix-turn-helix transcriptional regulator [Parvibaculum sp.]|uniref:helix-turn-helix transcriptional regulator n=1 Tax=Parvibaculum sp. TaxID=2024848 RepID=UPI001DC4CF78|nr:helix-turn-helix transcriptional regulator [Parvibaculum sp.]MBX3488575.1 helix-turn-helix transcriptional regulator [Parvibaculum sp.]